MIELADDRSLGAAVVWVAADYAMGATVGEAARRIPRDIEGQARRPLERHVARSMRSSSTPAGASSTEPRSFDW